VTDFVVTAGLKTAALSGALLVFHPGSGATVALTDDVLAVFIALQQGLNDPQPPNPQALPATDPIDAADRLDNCLRLLRQQQLIVPRSRQLQTSQPKSSYPAAP